MFNSLIPDCQNTILSFLPLESVIHLGGASRSCLALIQTELESRGQRFHQRFCYSFSAAREGSEQLYDSKAQLHSRYKQENHFPNHEGEERIRLLPTVRDRIHSLLQALDMAHPLHGMVRQLHLAINQRKKATATAATKTTTTTKEFEYDKCCSKNKTKFESLFQSHVDNVRSHKLHALILRQTIQSNPDSVDLGQTRTRRHDGSLTVTLDRFIGDVLCAFYLLGHSDSGIIEASPVTAMWQSIIANELNLDKIDELRGPVQPKTSMLSYYRAWIYLHSSILRVAPFSWQHQARLGIASPTPTSGEIASIDAAPMSLLLPHAPFRGSNLGGMQEFLRKLLLASIAPKTTFPPLHVSFQDFGRLGPVYRGRDMLESASLCPALVAAITIDCLEKDPRTFTPSGTVLTEFLPNWVLGQHPVIECMLHMREQSRRARPLTVIPPLVSFRPVLY